MIPPVPIWSLSIRARHVLAYAVPKIDADDESFRVGSILTQCVFPKWPQGVGISEQYLHEREARLSTSGTAISDRCNALFFPWAVSFPHIHTHTHTINMIFRPVDSVIHANPAMSAKIQC